VKLAALLFVADVDRERFNVLRRRGQLPIVRGTADDADAKQSTYDLADAFLIRVLLDLVGDGDDHAAVPPAQAAPVASNIEHTLRREGFRHPLNVMGADLWAGIVVLDEVVTDPQGETPRLRYVARFAGPASDLPAFLDAQANSEAQPVRVLLVNLSRAARFVRARAHELGLPEAEDFSEIWPA
jgi:hypothetical protein